MTTIYETQTIEAIDTPQYSEQEKCLCKLKEMTRMHGIKNKNV